MISLQIEFSWTRRLEHETTNGLQHLTGSGIDRCLLLPAAEFKCTDSLPARHHYMFTVRIGFTTSGRVEGYLLGVRAKYG